VFELIIFIIDRFSAAPV